VNAAFGRYRLLERLGQGGMAEVFKAKSYGVEGFEKILVIKRILPELARRQDFVDMFIHEAKLAVRLSHANIVQVFDLGKAPMGDSSPGAQPTDGYYIAMEYVHGLDLASVLARSRRQQLVLPVQLGVYVASEVAKGLDHAHRRRDEQMRPLGIVHRDVSPQNVLVSFEGEVKVTDFGIAKARGALDQAAPEDTHARKLQGKFGYMSPEQARGEALDPRSDVFAMGIILWELLAGRRLYKAGEGERLLDVARAAKVPELPPRDLPREGELYAIVARALRVDREERYPTAAAMLHDLEEYEAAARMVASQIRFGEWLMERFGHDIVRDRRARERAMRALARGPAAVIRPLPCPADAAPSPESPLSDQEATPSAFPVALRAGPAPAAIAHTRGETPIAGTVIAPRAAPPVEPAPRFDLRLLIYGLILVAMVGAVLRLLLGH
jgi:serine/threonine protein kinase